MTPTKSGGPRWRLLPHGAGAEAGQVAAIGITNQRETTLIWDRATGKPLHNAIVWQDRRTAARCAALKARAGSRKIARKTGLAARSVFLRHQAGMAAGPCERREGESGAGRVAVRHHRQLADLEADRRAVHATDVSNASRTMLFNLKTLDWDPELLKLFGVPRAMLPEMRDSGGDFGYDTLFGAAIPILGVAGDQQAASIGQACFAPGDVKSTYGTGCFVLVNTGARILHSEKPAAGDRALSQRRTQDLCHRGQHLHCRRGGAMAARCAAADSHSADAIEALAAARDARRRALFRARLHRPGRALLGSRTRAAPSLGLTRDMGKAEIARAALDAVCYQTRDLLEAMART